MKIACYSIFLSVWAFTEVAGDNFLLIHPIFAGSHVLTMHAVTEKLIQRGHKVTTVRVRNDYNLKLKNLNTPNHTEYHLYLNNSDGSIPFISPGENGHFEIPCNMLWKDGLEYTMMYNMPGFPWSPVEKYCETILGSEAFVEKLAAEKFDLAIVDLIYNECALALARGLDLPVVAYWAFSFSGGECEFPAVATPPSYIPLVFSRLTDTMSFFQRVYNFLFKCLSLALMRFHCWLIDGYVSKYFKFTKVPDTMQLLSEINGAIINSNPVLDYPRLKAETMLNIGGLQIREESNELPKIISDFMEGAANGVVLFSMGFVFDAKRVPDEQLNHFFRAFSRLPQRFIVKMNISTKNVPDNILVLPFLPQQEILAHTKTVAFFTHCGMHGVLEGVYHAVPMVGMPVFGDQGDIAVRMVQRGIAVQIDKGADGDEIYEALRTVIADKKYKENISKLSKLFRLRRNHPMDDAVWLLEYVSRTNGAKHLIPQGQYLNFAQYHALDVICFYFIIIAAIVYSIRLLCRSSVRRKKTKQE